MTGAGQEDGGVVQEVARTLLNESQVGDGEGSRAIESKLRMELEEKEEHGLCGGVPWYGQMDSMG